MNQLATFSDPKENATLNLLLNIINTKLVFTKQPKKWMVNRDKIN